MGGGWWSSPSTQPHPSAGGSHGEVVSSREPGCHPGKCWSSLCFPCRFLPDASRRGLFYISVEQISYTFWVFSHRPTHQNMPESSGECPSGPRPSGKTLIWTAAGGGTKSLPLKPLSWRRKLAKMAPKRGGERIYGKLSSVIKIDSFIRS